MIAKIQKYLINTDEVKYVKFDEMGYNLVKYGGEKYPLVSIAFQDSEKIEVPLMLKESLHEYENFKNALLENELIKLGDIIINRKKIKYLEFRRRGFHRGRRIPTVRIRFIDKEELDVELLFTTHVEEYEKFEQKILNR